ncbi:undecaprenyldiphospho-muramoylpentapeptide beta-N-acetylglucosaminyltransferase [Marinilabilia rubra]|uniref:UDP-N-acetylglucosamine--N-acetylmuramyl-(pentapeptide) pyrophosphoryl-undecaprenol N-acetylglucosamine transferase n=1 Tax=Marinilabilia rubra TaxID=2162893 RepID=A0A2U2BEC4_9BACT|nr:undecaprenyldiphospho-muramoylpentapeptide beta-N-acetylglucosaminyltransferase [Marinilabilia rubra]PWE01411.1 undecaprenyldiphospho-muramoylpentapeptide beta-N-acetylglucosaminyltransferase [Marinilabilia rubra]
MSDKLKIIISGGGTGGHIFPAISIADALKARNPETEILFVGAKGRMEMEKVPAAGYDIVGLPVAGFQRRLTWKNITFFFKLAASMLKARRVVRSFAPDVAIGVGGYASGPVLKAAASAGVPTVLQEQNSYPGVTNKILARKAKKICVAYPNMERFFPPSRIVQTGNPVRKNLLETIERATALKEFELDGERKTILVVGGSLGAGSINKGLISSLEAIREREDVQVLWQCGKYYHQDLDQQLKTHGLDNVKLMPFIARMDLAYGVADVVVSRAGAGTISELALLGKASVLVPSPNVSEDHQTKNAMSLVKEGAAILVADNETEEKLVKEALVLLDDIDHKKQLEEKIKLFAHNNSADQIAEEVEKIAKEKA